MIYDTAKYLEIRLGDKSGFAHSKTEHEGGTSTGESEQRVPLVTAQYIMYEMPDDEVFILYGGKWPAKVKRIPPLTDSKNVQPSEVLLLPAPVQQQPETVEQNPEPIPSWRLDPALLRWGSQYPTENST